MSWDECRAWLSTTLPYYIDITISRQDNDDRSCIFRWSPYDDGFSPSRSILLHHTADNRPQKVEIYFSGLVRLVEEDETLLVKEWNQNPFVWELRLGGKIHLKATLPERDQVREPSPPPTEANERVWVLPFIILKGTAVDWWDCGNKEEQVDTVVKLPCWIVGAVTEPVDNGGREELVVPASDFIEFIIVE
jgi:hypothetical protein